MADPRIGGLTCAEADDLAPAFVLGALTDPEMAAVRRHLAECGSEHLAFAELGSVAPALFEALPVVDPPPGLGTRIMAAARDERASGLQSAFQRRIAAPSPVPAPAPAPVAQRRPLAWFALAAAAVIAIAALGIWNFQLRGQVDQLSAYRNSVLAVMDRASAPNGQFAVLAAPGGAGTAAGLAGVGADGSVAVAMRNLAPTAGTQVYEVWVIGGDGKPVPVGDFTVGADGAGGTVTANGSSEAGITVALTREPGPGATTPTLPIIALGTGKTAGS
jgi:hypothetical protein